MEYVTAKRNVITQGMKNSDELQAKLLKPTLAIAKFFKSSGPANSMLKLVAGMLRQWARSQART